MILGYNTNGLAHHDLFDAVDLLAEIGYQSIAITIDHGVLNPYNSHSEKQLESIVARLEQLGMRSVIETGARFLLNPRLKHEPTLMSADKEAQARRIDFLKHAIDIAKRLKSDCVSIWSGRLLESISAEQAFCRLTEGLNRVLDYAEKQNIMVGFEPEPGMFVDSTDRFQELVERIDSPYLKLTLDVGHLHCTGEIPVEERIIRWGEKIVNVHIEDMRQGIHEHLMFGEGEMDFPPIVEAFGKIGYRGALHVELSRHSHDGAASARCAFEFLNPLLQNRLMK